MHLTMLDLPVRHLCAYAVLTLFLLFTFFNGLSYSFDGHWSVLSNSIAKPRFPDFSHYPELQTLSAEQFPLDDSTRRIIIVGDIHGMNNSLTKLLEKVLYKSSSDVLIHVGDILTKGSHEDSMHVLEFMSSHNVIGVRGNHDQKVIEWRAWIAWIRTQPGGRHWLDNLLAQWKAAGTPSNDIWLGQDARKKDKKWWRMIPPRWDIFGDHFNVAQAMNDEQYEYLRNLPIVIHIPTSHAYIVHAGILPSDPKHPYNSPRQPLTHVPQIPKDRNLTGHEREMELRALQELSILTQVPQNVVPYNNLNIRTIVKGKVTRKNDGQPWSTLWQHDMERCAGFNKDLPVEISKDESLPCYPSTVVYGHVASRGLDVKRWSIGLDSGCVYNKRLSALVLGSRRGDIVSAQRRSDEEDDSNEKEDEDEHRAQAGDQDITVNTKRIPFGSSYNGRIVSISCP